MNANEQNSDSREQDKFVIRLPDGMRPEIYEIARANQRSMNGEIIYRLQRSIALDQIRDTQEDLITQLLKRIDELESKREVPVNRFSADCIKSPIRQDYPIADSMASVSTRNSL